MTSDSAIKAKLKISLHAEDILIAQSEDPVLWQKVFAAITSKSEGINNGDITEIKKGVGQHFDEFYDSFDNSNSDQGLQDFAKALGISTDILQGACAPSKESPYLHLDGKYWESFFKNTPARGPSAVSRIGLAATLLCLWFKYARIEGNPTAADCQQVLETVNTREANPTRSIENSGWLQKRGKGIVINPAKTSRALEIAKTYCLEGKI